MQLWGLTLGQIARSTLVGVLVLALSRGIFLFLAGRGIHPDEWVATLLGYAGSVQVAGWAGWLMAAVVAALGILLSIRHRTWLDGLWPRTAQPAGFTPMREAVQRAYEALREHKGPSLETVERRAREEFGGSIHIACATGIGRHLTIHGEPRPSTVREPLSEQAHFELAGGAIRFAEDASKLLDTTGREVWANLAVKEMELSAHLKAIRAEMPAEGHRDNAPPRKQCDTWLLEATHYVTRLRSGRTRSRTGHDLAVESWLS